MQETTGGLIERGEKLEGLGKLGRAFGRCPSSLYRDAKKGTKSPGGEVIKHEIAWLGSKIYS